MKKVFKKLKQNTGETLTETLVALLISVLALTLLASMIASGNRITAKSAEEMNAYYAKSNSLAASSSTGITTLNGTVSIKQKVGNNYNGFCLTPGNSSYNVKFYVNDSFSNTPVVSYKVPASTM